MKLIVTGGAPLAGHVEEFLKVAFCCPVVQGFGLTETCAASCIAVPDKLVCPCHPACNQSGLVLSPVLAMGHQAVHEVTHKLLKM